MKIQVAVAGMAACLALTACGAAGAASHVAAPGSSAPPKSAARSSAGPVTAGSATADRASADRAAAPSPSSSPATSHLTTAAGRTAARPVVFDCLNHPVAEPGSYVLACADDGSLLIRLSWASWTGARAIATGVHELHDCTPSCAGSTKRNFYPAVITFWRPEPLPGHPGEDYFTRITVRYTTTARPPMYTSNGQLVPHPAQWTETLGR